jgi:hypothetical protein
MRLGARPPLERHARPLQPFCSASWRWRPSFLAPHLPRSPSRPALRPPRLPPVPPPKVAGTQSGITALQLDTKLPGLPVALLADALQPAAAARRKILATMAAALTAYEQLLPEGLQPRFGSVEIDKELVPRLIGLQVPVVSCWL